MKVSEAWLREWVKPSLTGEQLAAQLTMAGLEVDSRNPVAGEFTHVVVARVMHTMPHPQADKLTLCEVDAGAVEPIKVVCGAANVRAGLYVALALPGASLPSGMIIKESMLRGQLSQGMLCSGSELGMDDRSEGIMELADDAPIGGSLRDYLALNDYVLDIDLTPNRADCFSILGVAREVAALNDVPLRTPPSDVVQSQNDELMTVHLAAADGCPQYGGRIIRGINPDAITPLWMKERLRRGGIRALHPVVDVTNYVMLELGQPLHAFDLQQIDGAIHVRYSNENESIVLLDGQQVTLNDQVLVIADDKKPLAMAGIMGGAASAVQSTTTDIFIESAFFNPLVIAGVARRYGLCSDSSQRYERGVDPALQATALARATSLLISIVGGQVGPATLVCQPEKMPAKVHLTFKPIKVRQLTGIDIAEERMASMLQGLGMTITRQEESCWLVSVPPHRFDITLDVDLVEEIIRLYGYDKITASPLMTAMHVGEINCYERLSTHSAAFLSARGYNETISYSFVDPELQEAIYPDRQIMQLLNPISSELSQMRAGMWPGLLASMVYNVHRQQTVVKFFETGVVFDVDGDSLHERPCLAGLITGEQGHLSWNEPTRPFDFYDMKGDLQALFNTLNLSDVHFVAAEHPALHPGQSARIFVGTQEAGWLGVLHPQLLDALGLSGDVVLFEVSLIALLSQKKVTYQSISKYPQTRRDLSFLVDNNVSAAQIEALVREVVAKDWLKTFDIFDVYTGESIPAGKKSLGFSLTLQNDKRTLVDAEINSTIGAIIKKLDDIFSIMLRMDVV